MNNPYDIIVSRNENATSFVELNDQYNTLYNFLVNNQRQISYLDLYKITEYISTEAEGVQIGSKFAQLNPNTAIGIGVPSVKFNGETFYQGDLLLKLSNGQMQKLDAPSHGIYFPSMKTEENEEGVIIRSIVWNYSKDEPVSNTSSDLMGNNSAKWLLNWQIPSVETPNGYGQKIPSTKFTEQSAIINRIDNLVPIIKCFTTNNEEILADIKIESTTITETKNNETTTINVYRVSNIPSCVSYLMVR